MKRKTPIDRSHALEGVLAAALLLLLIGLISGIRPVLFATALFMASALLLRSFAEKAGRAWLMASQAIGTFSNHILLSLLFCLILTPVAIITRLVKRNLLQLRRRADAASYFVPRHDSPSRADFEKTW